MQDYCVFASAVPMLRLGHCINELAVILEWRVCLDEGMRVCFCLIVSTGSVKGYRNGSEFLCRIMVLGAVASARAFLRLIRFSESSAANEVMRSAILYVYGLDARSLYMVCVPLRPSHILFSAANRRRPSLELRPAL